MQKILQIVKLCVSLVLISALQGVATANSQDGGLTLAIRNKTVREALKSIESTSDYRFFYNDDFSLLDRKTDMDVHQEDIESVLKQLLADAQVTYKVMADNMVVILPVSELQQNKITGKVTDASTGEGLAGVTIQIKGVQQGTVTAQDGSYQLAVPDANATLIFSYVGYETLEIPVNGQSVVEVQLKEELTALDEVVVVGYGVQKKSVVTGAISSVTSDDMKNSSITRPEQALQGRSAGVQVISTSGAPGSEMKVRIRGYSSNGTADPLYIVDGVKTTNISHLSPQDISNMEVLKDAASSAIYGAEGGNGVIIITTKTGKSGHASIDYDFQYTMQNVGKVPEMLNAEEYANYYNEAGLMTINPDDIEHDTKWLEEIFEPTAATRHHISFTSGTAKSNFLLSVSSLSQDGIVVTDKDKYKRYTFRLNADNQVTNWLKVGNNVSFAYTKRNAITEDNESRGIITSALLMDPTCPVSYAEGEIPAHVQLLLDQGKKVVRDEEGQIYSISPYISKNPMNPFVGLDLIRATNPSYMLQGSLFAELTPIKHVTFTSRLGYEISNSDSKLWNPVYYYNSYNNYNDIASVAETIWSGKYWQWENFLSYTNSFNDHNISLLAGMSAEVRTRRYTVASGGPMIQEDENYADLNFISSQTSSSVGGQEYLDKKASYFGRLSYDYKNKYLLQGTVRRDGAGTSLLPNENRWGIFPSFSLGWVFTEEEFVPKSILTHGKLRASWGKNGSLSNLNNYMYSSVITSTYLLYQLGDGKMYTVAVPNQLNNPELTWETSVQTNIGLDLRFLSNKINVTMDYYNKKTTDLITPNTPPLESGNNASAVNGGDITNRGFEFQLEYRKSTGDFNYSITGNFATLHNEVTYLNPTIQRIYGGETSGAATFYTAFEKGLPVWYFRGYKTDGINAATGQPNFVDQNSDGLINESDRVMIGSAIPDFTYGANINLSYKGFDFSAALQGQTGNENMILWMRNDLPGSNVPKFLYEDRWTASNTDATRPKAGFDPKTLLSDQMLFDGSFMRVKQIQFGYTLPASLLNKVKLKSARVYVSLEDYFTFTKYPGMDPEAGSTTNSNLGLDKGMYPITRKALFGLSVSL